MTGALNVDWDDRLPTRPAIDDEQRFAILRRLLHDPEPVSASAHVDLYWLHWAHLEPLT